MDQNTDIQVKEPEAAEVVYKIGKRVFDNEQDYEIALKERKAKIARIWDKVTTGILILLMASPVLILSYIFLWFIFK